MHTQMNINAMEDDSRVCVQVCVLHEYTQTDTDRLQKLEHHTQRGTRTLLRALRALPSETAEPPLQLRGGRKA